MCRNIKTLFNFDPPATDEEINAAALQFVRKISGFRSPSRVNETAFNEAVEQISLTGLHLLRSLTTAAPARDREVEERGPGERSARRFGGSRERSAH